MKFQNRFCFELSEEFMLELPYVVSFWCLQNSFWTIRYDSLIVFLSIVQKIAPAPPYLPS